MRERDPNASGRAGDALIKLPARISLHPPPRPHPFSVPGSFDQSRVRHEGGPFQSVDSPTRRLPGQYGVSYVRNSSTGNRRLYSTIRNMYVRTLGTCPWRQNESRNNTQGSLIRELFGPSSREARI